MLAMVQFKPYINECFKHYLNTDSFLHTKYKPFKKKLFYKKWRIPDR